jgi:hypothetical protein
MAQQLIDVGTTPNDGQGDPIRTSFIFSNENFSELYARAQPTPPVTFSGSPGDVAGMYAYDSTYFYYCFANYDGSSTIWAQITQIGNVSINSLVNGTSNVQVELNSNVTVSVAGSDNVVVISSTGQFVQGTLSTSGNITGSYILGNGSQLSGLPELYGNANVANYLPTYSGNLASLNGPVTTDGAITGAALLVSGFVSATGNITGNYIYGNGAFLTGVTGGGGGNATNIQNGITIVDIPVNSGNVTVNVGFSSNIVVITSDGMIVDGSVTANTVSSSTTMIATGNITGGNLLTAGQISSTGNITGDYIIGDGSFLTNVGVSTSYSNANVAAYLPTYTGNLSAGNLSVTGQANVTGNVNVNYQSTINGTVNGQLYGLVNGINDLYGTWDFGFIAANTYNNPIQWIFALTSAGNVDMGTVTAPASLDIDIGTIF